MQVKDARASLRCADLWRYGCGDVAAYSHASVDAGTECPHARGAVSYGGGAECGDTAERSCEHIVTRFDAAAADPRQSMGASVGRRGYGGRHDVLDDSRSRLPAWIVSSGRVRS